MMEKWLIVGVSGVTCGGKTTLSTHLNKTIPNSVMISQDDYFLDVDNPRHTWIAELNHINFDIISSLDMEKMYRDIMNLIKIAPSDCRTGSKNGLTVTDFTSTSNLEKVVCDMVEKTGTKVLILEGFCIFNYKPIADLCRLKYYFTLTKEECYERRITRVYEPPDCPGYFEKCVWPEYLNLLKDVEENVKSIKYFDGSLEPPIAEVLLEFCRFLN